MKQGLNILLICLALASCSQQKQVSSYIDTDIFFETQIRILTQQKAAVHKNITFGNKHEEITLTNVDWEKELSSFAQIELQKPSYNGRFKVDTVKTDDHHHTITYRGIDPKIGLREVIFTYDDNQIRSVKAILQESNSLYRANKTLIYYTDSGYSIEGSQQVSLGNAVAYSIEATLMKP